MTARRKGRISPRIDPDALEADLITQLATGAAYDARYTGELPPLESAREQRVSILGSLLDGVTLASPRASRLLLSDVRIQNSDLANVEWPASTFERVEILSTRLTGAVCNEARWRSVLFRDCKLDLAVLRMAALDACVFEQCNLSQADFYEADLTGTVFRQCDLGGADLSGAKLTGADIRECRIDGMRGTPAAMDGMIISPEQACLLITLFGVVVKS